MAEYKILVIFAALIISAGSATALDFQVEVESITETAYYDTSYINQTETVQVINTTVENQGSIGCTYRLKAEFKQGKKSFTRYSKGYPMWPGDAISLEIRYIPMHYTGKIDTNLSVTYCGLEEKISSFAFNSTERNSAENKVESEKIKVNTTHADIKLPLDNGTLVPQESPSYWKTSSSEIKDGRATVSYDAPIFQESAKLKYTVLDSENQVLGQTSFNLVKPEPTLREKVEARIPEILAIFLALSMVLNFYLVRCKILPERLLKYLEELEFGDREIKKS